jgi:hypothetical protein
MNATSKCSHVDTGIPSACMGSVNVVDGQHRIVAISWAAGKRLGRVDRVDLSPLIDSLRFYAPLRKNPALFETARLIDDGYAMAWGDSAIDMSAESVERLAEEAMTGTDFGAFLARNSLTHQAAAAVLGRSKRQVEHYLQYEQLPRMAALACFGYEARREVASQATHPLRAPRSWTECWDIDHHQPALRFSCHTCGSFYADRLTGSLLPGTYITNLTYTYENFHNADVAGKVTDRNRKTKIGILRSRQKDKSASG